MASPVPPPPGLHRLALVSLHTSPLAQPGTGDAGGMNVYVAQTARRLAARGIEVEIFTRATSSVQLSYDPAWPGVTVRHVVAGPFEGLDKNDLPGQLCSFAAGVMRAEARQDPGYYDLVHSHYWLSGQVGFLVRDRWAVPLVHSAHTLAKVKNGALAVGDSPEPRGRLIGEDQVVAEADRLIANTALEAGQLVDLYDADPDRIDVVAPGVDTDTYRPGSKERARRLLGIGQDEIVLAFAGRVQPLKAPDVLVRAAAKGDRARPDLPLRVLIVGGLSGTGRDMGGLGELAADEGIGHLLDSREPVAPEMLAEVYRAADLVAVPSYNESFGLVALEAQACGTPVVAAAVGGLTVAVRDDVTGLLVDGHDIDDWAATLGKLIDDPQRRAALGAAAPAHAAQFSWEVTVDGLLSSYGAALSRLGRSMIDARAVGAALAELGAEVRPEGDDAFLVTLPGERRHRTLVWLVVGTHELLVESFVCRKPDENDAQVHRFLLQRNAKLRTVAYTLDGVGDIHLVGRLGLRGLDAARLSDELDTVLGVVLATSDADFNLILERGFASAIRREWAWRTSTGQSVRNLEAFRHLITG